MLFLSWVKSSSNEMLVILLFVHFDIVLERLNVVMVGFFRFATLLNSLFEFVIAFVLGHLYITIYLRHVNNAYAERKEQNN
jgi:hypothetical protein